MVLRKGKWKLVKRYQKDIELYDLEIDEGEITNVAENNPKIIEKMIAILANARTENPDFHLIKAYTLLRVN